MEVRTVIPPPLSSWNCLTHDVIARDAIPSGAKVESMQFEECRERCPSIIDKLSELSLARQEIFITPETPRSNTPHTRVLSELLTFYTLNTGGGGSTATTLTRYKKGVFNHSLP